MNSPEVAAAGFAWEPLLYAVALLVGAVALLVLEFFVVSFGVLLVAALAAVGGALYFAFQVSDAVGWLFVLIVPVLAYGVTRWGIARMQSSRLIPKRAITEEAGYHHYVDSLGIAPGSEGRMVTPGRPLGRARFGGGECDVQAISGVLELGANVVVERVEGPVVYVSVKDV